MSIVIKIENLSKQYRLGLVSTRTLSHDLNRWWTMNIRGKEDPYLKIGETAQGTEHRAQSDLGNVSETRVEQKSPITNHKSQIANISFRPAPRALRSEPSSDYIWALRDINLEVEQGDVLGIIGKNGAGKSTLLKILSKVTAPSTGTVRARGRIASLLEVGTGFHPEMTGRENIYMNGAIMGMTKTEITRKLDEIIDFAGVETFIDTPVKRYSSGMTVRLGFAVAAHLELEILVVDEVLAIGDEEFQKKAVGKMHDISIGFGKTVLFVSHNINTIKVLCNKAIIINSGEISDYGETHDIVSKYIEKSIVNLIDVLPNNDHVVVHKVYIEPDQKIIKTNLDDLFICVEYSIYQNINKLRMVLTFKSLGVIVFETSDYYLLKNRINKGRYLYRVKLPKKLLGKELYTVSIRFDIPNRIRITEDVECLNFKLDYIEFNQMGYRSAGEPKGIMHPEIQWELLNLD